MTNDNYKIIDLELNFDHVDDAIIRWIIALSLASNDISFCHRLILKYIDCEESVYLLRLSFSHLREIAKIIGDSKSNEKIKCFLEKLDPETKQVYSDIVDLLGSFDNGDLAKEVLKNIRDVSFHYPRICGGYEFDEKVPQILKALDKKQVRFSRQDTSMLSVRYLFADCVVGFKTDQHLSKEIVDKVSESAFKIIQFVDHVLNYLKTRQNAILN